MTFICTDPTFGMWNDIIIGGKKITKISQGEEEGCMFFKSLFSYFEYCLNITILLQVDDEMFQCVICEDWYHQRVC